MVAQEAPRSPPPVDQVEIYTTRDLPPRPGPGKKCSSASALRDEMDAAFESSADDPDSQSNKLTENIRSKLIRASNISPSGFDSIKQEEKQPETEGRRGSIPTWEASPTPKAEPDPNPTGLRPAVPRFIIDTTRANKAAVQSGKKTPRSARYEPFRSSSKPRHPRLQHERHSEEDSDTSSVGMYHKAAEELARDQKASVQQVKSERFSYGAHTLGSHDEDSDTDDDDAWHRSGHFLSPPPAQSVPSSVRETPVPFRGSNDSFHTLDLSEIQRGRLDRHISVYTFGGRGQNSRRSPSPSASSRLSEHSLPPKSPLTVLRRSLPTSELIKSATASTINESTSGISSELLLAGNNRESSSSYSQPLSRHSSIISRVLFVKRISSSTPITITHIGPPPPTPAPTPISPSLHDMPLLNPRQAQQVHASLPPMNPPPAPSESSSSTSLSGLSLAALAQKTKAITSAGFKNSDERRRAKLKSKIRVFGDGGTMLGSSEKGVELVGVRKPEPETEQRRVAYNYKPIPGGLGDSGSSETLGGTMTPMGTMGAGTGAVVFGRDIKDSTRSEMWTGGRFGARTGIDKVVGQGQQQQNQGLLRPFVVPTAGQMDSRGKSPARQQQYGQVSSGGVGGQTVLSPPPQPPPSKALPRRPSQQAREQENAGARYGNARLRDVMNYYSKGGGSGNGSKGGGGGALVDSRGNVPFPTLCELDGVRPVL